MTKFQKELLDGIEEVSMTTGITVKECIRQAIELSRKQSYKDKLYENMFRGW